MIHFGQIINFRVPETGVTPMFNRVEIPMEPDVAAEIAEKYLELLAKGGDVYVVTQSPTALEAAGIPREAIILARLNTAEPKVMPFAPFQNKSSSTRRRLEAANLVRFLTERDAFNIKYDPSDTNLDWRRDLDRLAGRPSLESDFGLTLLSQPHTDVVEMNSRFISSEEQ